MSVIVNPSGRLVILDDPKQVEYWLTQPGFRKASIEEEKEFIGERNKKFQEKATIQEKGKGIYLSTVSVGGKDGYGIASELIIRELDKIGVKVMRYYDGQSVSILFHNPYGITRMESPYRIIFTMFESTKIPDDWIPYLESASEVWVPSKWCSAVFAKAGIKAKVIPLGYDDQVFKYKEREVKNKYHKNFTFLHFNAFNVRKGFLEVFKAFTQEFQKDEPVRLLLKTTLNQAPLPITKSQYPNIDIIFGKNSEKQLLDIMYDSDCFVFPSRGEGFGMTPLECMATGMSAIVPNAHGISEYFNREYMYEVKVKEECPALYSRYKGIDVGKMVVCDVDDLRKKMRWAYEHQEENLKMGLKASEYVKNWTFKKTAQMIKAEYEQIISKPITQPKFTNVLPLEMVK